MLFNYGVEGSGSFTHYISVHLWWFSDIYIEYYVKNNYVTKIEWH